ncbi:hypothetical protein OR16_05664 [Cupriavidus basilensis OR16]|uniref:General secretion pathway protein C n=1 Tax=Cupriavidus basilensis OR16 TaxID=1127483 RepID=H1S0J7_9BURK|nr:hypothetical protein OR16_05664 [Cupriavidus basilensis OR16]
MLFVALCALATRWALTFSAMQTIAVPQAARVAQTEAVETGAAGTLFGGNAQSGVRDVQLIGVVADIGSGAGAAIVSLDGGLPKAVRAGTALSPQIRLTEVRDRGIVIERNGVRQEIALPVPAIVTRGPAAAPPGFAGGSSGAALHADAGARHTHSRTAATVLAAAAVPAGRQRAHLRQRLTCNSAAPSYLPLLSAPYAGGA